MLLRAKALNSFRRLICFFVMAAALLDKAESETFTLRLRDGDKLTGQIISETTNHVVLTNQWIKELIVPKNQIVGRDKTALSPEQTPATTPSPIAVISANTNRPPVKPPAASVTAAVASPTKPKPPRHWHGEVQVGTDLRFSEKDRQLYYSRFKIIYARELQPKRLFKTVFDYNAAYGESDGILSDNRMEGSVKTDYDLTKRVFAYNLMGSGYDEIRKIDFRYEIGPGVGYHLFVRTNFIMNLEAGANYQARYYTDNREDDRIGLRMAEDAIWKIATKLTVDEKFEFFPGVDDLGDYRLRFETNLRYLLFENLSLNFTLLDIYETEPARNVSRNDLQIRSSLGLKF